MTKPNFKTLAFAATPAMLLLTFALTQGAGAAARDTTMEIRIGLSAAPVPLNLTGKNSDLVGFGSYLVNVVGDCNGCHSAGPQTEFAPGGNPYAGQPKSVNPATYLGGGRDFGPLIPGSASRSSSSCVLRRAECELSPGAVQRGSAANHAWPGLSQLSNHDLKAIYEYLSAIPCISGPAAPSPLHNDCQ